MMRYLDLKTVDITPKLMSFLERRKLVRALKPTAKTLKTRTKTGAVDTFYVSSPKYGSHKLICVGKRSTEIKMSYHPDNEDLIIAGPTGSNYKPLILILGLQKSGILERKARSGKLESADFLALRLKYNDFETGLFTLLKETVHCEVTLPGKGQHPVFFVGEPSRLKIQYLGLAGYKLRLD